MYRANWTHLILHKKEDYKQYDQTLNKANKKAKHIYGNQQIIHTILKNYGKQYSKFGKNKKSHTVKYVMNAIKIQILMWSPFILMNIVLKLMQN